MRAASATSSLLLATTLLSGCAVGPNYKRPEMAAPAAFMGQAAVDQRAAATTADFAEWWKSFNDPMLSELVERALAQNLDIAQAVSRVTQSRAALNAATANLLPSGGISGDVTHYHQSLENPLGILLNAADYDRNGELYEGNATASWEIDLFGGLRRGHEAARAEWQASLAGVAGARLSVAAQTADAYVTVRGLQARLAIANEQVDTQNKQVSTIKLQYEKGVAAELQLRQAEGALAQVQANVPLLETSLDAALNSLDVLMGAQPGTYRAQLLVPGNVPTAPSLAGAGGPADLIRRRPDLIIAERRLAASNARIGQAISEYFPKFSLTGLVGTATTAFGSSFSSGANQAQGVLGLRWRLFDFGRINAEIKSAKGQNAEALAAYRLSVLRASEDVEDSFSTLVKREAQERTLEGGEKSLARARSASFAAYKGGVVSLIEVLDADRRLLDTRDARAQAQMESARAAISSFRALGGGWNAPNASG